MMVRSVDGKPVRRFASVAMLLVLLWPVAGCGLAGLRFYRNVGKSMEPTLHEGNRVAVSATFYAHNPLQDGDIIVFRHNGNVIIKRISALPGETIEGKQGILFRDGRKLREPYVAPLSNANPDNLANFPAQKVAEGRLFVTGDNRAMSLDSRSSEFGEVRQDEVIGKFMGTY